MHLSSFTLALGVLATSGAALAQSFTYTDFSSVSGLNLIGLAAQAGTTLRLQDNVAPANGGDNRAAVWYATPLCVVNGFDTTFTYRMHTPSTTGGSDGLAFVIHNDQIACSAPIVNGGPDGAGNLAIGRHASACGFGVFANPTLGDSVDNSIAIHLDTYNNGAMWGDPDANHVSVLTGGSADNSQHESYSIGRATPATDLNLNGTPHVVRVIYTPGTPGTLQVHLDGAVLLTVPYSFATGGTWVDSTTPVGGLNLIGGTSAYVGFTSGAGTAREFRDIQGWIWSSPCSSATSFCSGDGTGTACPCGNSGAAGNGCASSLNASGANLAATGVPSIASDSFVLHGSGMPNSNVLYFQGTLQQNGGVGSVFGDGLRCAGGQVVRLWTKTNAGGASQAPDTGDQPISIQGLNVAGNVRTYQAWYRNSAAFCTPDGWNLTNGVATTWAP
jgi:hypothetical protein